MSKKRFCEIVLVAVLAVFLVSCVSIQDREMTVQEREETLIVGTASVSWTSWQGFHVVNRGNLTSRAQRYLTRIARQEFGPNVEVRNINIIGSAHGGLNALWYIGFPAIAGVAGIVINPDNPSGGFILNSAIGLGISLISGNFQRITATGDVVIHESALAREYITVPLVDIPQGFIEMVQVDGGVFELGREMGTAGEGDFPSVSTVTVAGFYMGRYAVTQEQFETVMGINPSWHTATNGRLPVAGETDARRPVEMVNWYHAIMFANRLSMMSGLTPAYEMQTEADSTVWSTDPALWGAIPTNLFDPIRTRWDSVRIVAGSTGYRLPTGEQWEFAAKGGANPTGNFTFAGSNNANDVAWHNVNSGITREVGQLQANCLGIHDMSGNVWEWIWDWLDGYTNESKTDPAGASSVSFRMIRGGSFTSSADGIRSVAWGVIPPSSRAGHMGFRLVRPTAD